MRSRNWRLAALTVSLVLMAVVISGCSLSVTLTFRHQSFFRSYAEAYERNSPSHMTRFFSTHVTMRDGAHTQYWTRHADCVDWYTDYFNSYRVRDSWLVSSTIVFRDWHDDMAIVDVRRVEIRERRHWPYTVSTDQFHERYTVRKVGGRWRIVEVRVIS